MRVTTCTYSKKHINKMGNKKRNKKGNMGRNF